jgi:hypothetical protein
MRFDPPNDYGCDAKDPRHLCFQDFIKIAIAAGLTVQEVTSTSSPGKAGGGAAGKESGGGGDASGGASKSETTIYARLCFDPVLGERAQREMGQTWLTMKRFFDVSLAGPKCGGQWNPVKDAQKLQPDTLNFNVGPYQFKIIPRSAFGVFQFLGTLMKMQRNQLGGEQNAYVPPNRDDVGPPPLLATGRDDLNVITVVQNGPADCFVHTWFIDGDYCVPETATNTKRIFSLLAQLIAIQTAASDLSITPVVRVIQ